MHSDLINCHHIIVGTWIYSRVVWSNRLAVLVFVEDLFNFVQQIVVGNCPFIELASLLVHQGSKFIIEYSIHN